MNMSALTKGHLLSSFWVVDKRHFYIGSAGMDWRSLATVLQTHLHVTTQPKFLISSTVVVYMTCTICFLNLTEYFRAANLCCKVGISS